jgi:3-phosphoshikimate 1-carboxyvinyltransferase
MAMSMAPGSFLFKPLVINDPMVITKSYPSFWEDLKLAGFTIQPK